MSGAQEAACAAAVAEGISSVLKSTVEEIDSRVTSLRQSQLELRQNIESLSEELRKIAEEQKGGLNVDAHLKTLQNCKRRVMLVNNLLQNTHERLQRLQSSSQRANERRRQQLREAEITNALTK